MELGNDQDVIPQFMRIKMGLKKGVSAIRTRVFDSAQTNASFNPRDTVTIIVNTSNPGTCTDVSKTTLDFRLDIINSNHFIDFVNFGRCGAQILINKYRLLSQSIPLYENEYYSEAIELENIAEAQNDIPFHIFRQNEWRFHNGGAGERALNAIKPSMVDMNGQPMYGSTPFRDACMSSYVPPRGALFGSTADTQQLVAGDLPPLQTAATATNYSPDSSASFSDLFTAAYNFGATGQGVYTAGNGTTAAVFIDATSGDDNNVRRGVMAVGGVLSTLRSDPFTQKPYTGIITASSGALSANAYSWQAGGHTTPAQWPENQPFTMTGEKSGYEIELLHKKVKFSKYMRYLANVKSIPVGLRGKLPANTGYDKAGLVAATESRSLQLRLSMPLQCPLLGRLAPKAFMDMMVAARSLSIEIELASPSKVFYVTMDPCRRVPGTVRDFVPFTGTRSGVARTTRLGQLHDALAPLTAADMARGCQRNFVAVTTTAHTAHCFKTDSVLGEDYIDNIGLKNQVHAVTTKNAVTYATTYPYVGTAAAPLDADALNCHSHSIPISNLPKPQYVLSAKPWEDKDPTVSCTYAHEANACYGTYLPASCAQTRRCLLDTRLAVDNSSVPHTLDGGSGLTYKVQDVKLMRSQLLLNDEVASDLLSSVISSEVSIYSTAFKGVRVQTQYGEQQQLIVPLSLGQAQDMSFIFRVAKQFNETTALNYYYNSFYCPFAGLSYQCLADPTAAMKKGLNKATYEVGGLYTLKSNLDGFSNTNFSVQLLIGAVQMPVMPLTSFVDLVNHMEITGNKMNREIRSAELMSFHFMSNESAENSVESRFAIDHFRENGAFTTFVDVSALDDQTITGNPYWNILETTCADLTTAATEMRLRGSRVPTYEIKRPSASSTELEWRGVMNIFTSPIANFVLKFDFLTWPDQRDQIRGGKSIGLETVQLNLRGASLFTVKNTTITSTTQTQEQIICDAICRYWLRIVYYPGGSLGGFF